VIGGGAAGFFAALTAKKAFPQHTVVIFEKTSKVLAKVKVSGGGRCNVTNACFDTKKLAKYYPRGENHLKKAFEQFSPQSTIEWFKTRGVDLKTYPDNCIFPQSNDSQTIIDCFLNEAKMLGVEILMNQSVSSILKIGDSFEISTSEKTYSIDKIIVTAGGQPKRSGLSWLENTGHTIIDPVPSLFTFNMPDEHIRELMGNVVEQTTVRIEGTKLTGKGPLLITHWGMSGPAILQLSAWGARLLAGKNYEFALLVNWLNETKEEDLKIQLSKVKEEHSEKMLGNLNPFPMTARLWNFLLDKSGIHHEIRWKDLSSKNSNKLINTLLNDRYRVRGKTTFKEEFVTAGGISLNDINIKTMESKKVPGMFFAGEIVDIDGITGGFNFQAAWTTGYIAGKNCGN
jgi:predicted Rossmann fold flavoprotein